MIAAGSSLSAKKRTKVEFNRTVKYPNAIQSYVGRSKTTGKTSMDATFTFTRLGR